MTRPQISVFIAQSLDGYIARPDHSIDWLETFDTSGEDHGYQPFYDSCGALVIGRATLEVALQFTKWPWEGKRVIVATHRPIGRRHGEETHEGPFAPLFERLAREGVKRVYLDGGETIRLALAEGLVDDMTITTLPILLGAGRPLFGGPVVPERWKVVMHRAFPSGLVQGTWIRDDT